MLKTSHQPIGALLATSVNDSKVVSSSSKNDRKLAKSDFTNPVHGAEESSFLTSDTR